MIYTLAYTEEKKNYVKHCANSYPNLDEHITR